MAKDKIPKKVYKESRYEKSVIEDVYDRLGSIDATLAALRVADSFCLHPVEVAKKSMQGGDDRDSTGASPVED